MKKLLTALALVGLSGGIYAGASSADLINIDEGQEACHDERENDLVIYDVEDENLRELPTVYGSQNEAGNGGYIGICGGGNEDLDIDEGRLEIGGDFEDGPYVEGHYGEDLQYPPDDE
jgi:hypothetical protein